jgi:uncharacterized protein (DUF1499 family)
MRIFLAGLILMTSLKAASEAGEVRIKDCPARPNCISSLARDDSHFIAPFRLKVDSARAWAALREALRAEPRTSIVEEDQQQFYLRAEVVSRIFRFVDDVEAQVVPAENILHVRSAARLGYWDLGVNRRRLERLRAVLQKMQVIA